MSRLSEAAKKKTMGGSPLQEGRSQITVDEIIKNGGHVTVNDMDILTNKNGDYPVFTCEEDAGVFFYGGSVLMDIANEWINLAGSVEQVSKELAEEPIELELSHKKSESGRKYVAVKVCE